MKRHQSFSGNWPLLLAFNVSAQTPPGDGPPPGGPGGRGGGPGGGNRERAVVAQFDNDKDGRLNTAERVRAMEFVIANPIGRNRGGGRGGGGPTLSPLVTQHDDSKPIIARILAVPALRAKYFGYVKEIADKSFDWQTLGPVVKQYRDLIADDVARDTRKLYTTEQFLAGTADEPGPGSLRSFFDQRRAFLLSWTEPGATETSNQPAAPR